MARALASRSFRFLFVLAWPALVAAQSVKLSPTLARDPGAVIVDTRFSPDGLWVVYETDSDEEVRQIFSVPAKGDRPALLLASPSARPDVVIGPDGARLFYTDDALYVTPLDKRTPLRIGGSEVPTGRSGQLQLAPDGGHAFYLAQEAGGPAELFTVPADGSAGPTKLDDPLAPGGGVSEFLVAPDGTFVVYVAQQGTLGTLLRVPADGSASALPLSGLLGPGSDVAGQLQFSSDGGRVLYLADSTSGGPDDLFSVPIDASANPVRLNGDLVQSGEIFEFASASGRVVYRAEQRQNGLVELFGAPLDGSTPAVRLSAPLVNGGAVDDEWVITPDGAQVVYLADQLRNDRFEIFRVPLDASAPAVRVNTPFDEGMIDGFRLDPAGMRVVFTRGPFQGRHLRSVFLDGSGDVPLTSSHFGLGNRTFLISSDGLRVVHRARPDPLGPVTLFSVAIDGLSAEIDLSRGPTTAGFPPHFLVAPDNRVVYFTPDIHSVAIDGLEEPRRLSAPLAGGPVIGDVRSFQLVDSGARVLFAASGGPSNGTDENPMLPNELYSVPVDGQRPAELLYPHAGTVWGREDVTGYGIADGRRLVFKAGSDWGEYFDLFSTSADGPEAPVRLNQAALGNWGLGAYEVSPLGDRVVYDSSQENSTDELFVSDVDGTSETPLSGDLVPGGSVIGFRIGLGGSWVAYVADQLVDGRHELFGVPIDASAGPVPLQGALVDGGDVHGSLAISPDGARVVYLADQDVDEVWELHSVPIDASASAVELSGALPPGGDVLQLPLLTPDGRAVYVADQDENDVLELYCVPLDASASSIRISGPMVAGGGLASGRIEHVVQLAPDGQRAVYLADQETDGVLELFVARTDGSASPQKLSGALVAGGNVATGPFPAFAISPDGARVVYLADQEKDEVFELFVVPIDASAAPTRIHGALLADADVVSGFGVSPDSAWVVFAADLRHDETFELFAAPIGGGPLRRMNGPLVAGGDAITDWRGPLFGFTPDSRRVVYVADQDTDGVFELYASFLARPHAGAAGPTRTVERASD